MVKFACKGKKLLIFKEKVYFFFRSEEVLNYIVHIIHYSGDDFTSHENPYTRITNVEFGHPGVNFTSVFVRIFCTKFWQQKLLRFEVLSPKILYEKCVRKTLMKLTAVESFFNHTKHKRK